LEQHRQNEAPSRELKSKGNLRWRQRSYAERLQFGRSLRKTARRVDQAAWTPSPKRSDPLVLIQESNAERLSALVPIKIDRMVASPFGFFRGAAPVMAADLAGLPTTGLHVQICGDAHVRNLGAFAAPDGHLVFDINDFDETTPGPWEWDLKRLATSLVLAGREAGDRDRDLEHTVREFVRTYRESMLRFSRMPILDLARLEVRDENPSSPVGMVLAKAERATPLHALVKLTLRTKGGLRFHDASPLLRHVPSQTARQVLAALGPYRHTLSPDRQLVLDAYGPVDVAFKVVGTGSIGTRDYIVLLFGSGENDPLVLQIKEELPSCYARYLPRVPACAHQGRRVAEGQHRMQTVSDPFLGWTSIEGRDYLVRQLADHKASVDPMTLRGRALVSYARICGTILAKAHARTGNAVAIAGYCGRSAKLDVALARFAHAYADQTAKDHAQLRQAVQQGKIRRRKA
jgi:uncharacterized protein (DUF2252 family)